MVKIYIRIIFYTNNQACWTDVRFMLTLLCNVMLRRVPCYGCAFCASLRDTDSKLRGRNFVTFISSQVGLESLTCCSAFSIPCWLNACIYKASQHFICVSFEHVFSNCNVITVGPYSCLFCKIFNVQPECVLLVILYLTCSLYLTFKELPDCPTYTLLRVLQFSLYIPL